MKRRRRSSPTPTFVNLGQLNPDAVAKRSPGRWLALVWSELRGGLFIAIGLIVLAWVAQPLGWLARHLMDRLAASI